MLQGDPYTPGSKFDLTSLRVLNPKLSILTWLGYTRPDKRIPIYNLYNHTQTPVEDGWSVRFTQVRDFRGKQNSYDSHNGTDFAIPVGTIVTAAAPGRVIRVSSEFHRGGLKVFIDHGHGLVTTSNHLGRALVHVGQDVQRGQPIALSGASGVDMVAAFPFNAPHVHYNVWLNGTTVDPFSHHPNTPSIWLKHNDPRPHTNPTPTIDQHYTPTDWDDTLTQNAIATCKDPQLRHTLENTPSPSQRATDTLFAMNYYPTRFEGHASMLYPQTHPRTPTLSLPFRHQDFIGIVHLDD